ncbi:hypothetical protein S40288_07672 [Stachybotrys chartarum IBT 40288]|nr:hypothetical protein S40288_07672 [Stachybotrys chartarum IBT 40288]
MAAPRYPQADLRRHLGSPRPKGRENKDTLCRNVLIYGHCRYEDQGCAFSHDQNKGNSNQQDSSKKALNVESPSFTPAKVPSNGKKPSFTTQAASAPAFTPRGLGAATPAVPEPEGPVFNPATIREFTPSFEAGPTTTNNGPTPDGSLSYDPFSMTTVNQSLPTTNQFNPYAEDHATLAATTSAFYQPHGAFTAPPQPPQYHLYAPQGPHRDDLKPYQRQTHDYFMPEKLQEELMRKYEATLQTMPNSQLPQLDNFHSLVALDTSHRKNASIFGYPSWVYKACSKKTGHFYCLRRLEGYRLSNEHAIKSVKEWRRIDNANVVTIFDAFTTRAFGDSSLIFVQNYHPLSKTLAELHLAPTASHGNRFQPRALVPESTLWSYIVQIANALRAVHAANLAARTVDVSKIILTDRNHIRLTACSILDVVQFETRRPVHDLQQEDLIQFGRTILSLATNTLPAHLTNLKTSLEQLSRTYSVELRDTVYWLLTPQQPPAQKGIEEFLRGISDHVTSAFDESLHETDEWRRHVSREAANGRVARLMLKLSTVNERYDLNGDQSWAETGDRYLLKLFRDFVFHQVDSNGNPVLDIGHMLGCLNKLDAGTEERICLTSRDEQTSFIVSYKELKKQLGNAFGELQKASKHGRGP